MKELLLFLSSPLHDNGRIVCISLIAWRWLVVNLIALAAAAGINLVEHVLRPFIFKPAAAAAAAEHLASIDRSLRTLFLPFVSSSSSSFGCCFSWSDIKTVAICHTERVPKKKESQLLFLVSIPLPSSLNRLMFFYYYYSYLNISNNKQQ